MHYHEEAKMERNEKPWLKKQKRDRAVSIEENKILPSNFAPGNWDVICHRGSESYEHGTKSEKVTNRSKDLTTGLSYSAGHEDLDDGLNFFKRKTDRLFARTINFTHTLRLPLLSIQLRDVSC